MTPESLLTLTTVASNPSCATFRIDAHQHLVLEPLAPRHEASLAAFFEGLSPQTRRFYSVASDVRRLAYEHCSAIARYDKLRLILRSVDPEGSLVAIVEFSLDMPAVDIERFATYGFVLSPGTDCRWGLCVADQWQRSGIGTALAAPSFDIARRFGKNRIILWGGVHTANSRATHYYRKVGFAEVGSFKNGDGIESIDMLRSVAGPTSA